MMPEQMRALLHQMLRFVPFLLAVGGVAVILQPTQPAILLERYSRTSLVVFAALLVGLVVMRLALPRIERLLTERVSKASLLFHAVALLACAIVLVSAGSVMAGTTTSYLIISMVIIYTVITLALPSLGRFTAAAHGGTATLLSAKASRIAVLILTTGLIALSLRFPGQLWTDEGYNTGLALSIARTGEIAVPYFSLTPELYGPNYALTYIAAAGVFNLFGVQLVYARLLIYAVGLLGLGIISWVCARRYSAAIARIVFAIGAVVLLAGNYFRADIEVALWLSIAFWAIWRAELTGRKGWYCLAGLAIGFSVDGHPNAYRFAVVFVLLAGVDWLVSCIRQRKIQFNHAVFYVFFGAVLGVAAYIALYSALAPTAFGARAGSAQIGLYFAAFPVRLQEQFLSLLHNGGLLMGLALLAMTLTWKANGNHSRLPVWVWLGSSVVLALTYGYYRDYYFVHLFPVYALLAGAALDAFEKKLPERPRQRLMNALFVLLMCVSLGWLWAVVRADAGQDYGQARVVADEVRAYIAQDDIFIAPDPLYVRMYDYPNFVEFNVGLYMALRDQITEAEAWERIAPDAVVIIRNYPIPPPQSLLDYVTEHGFTMLRCWEGSQIGRVELYMKQPPTGMEAAVDCPALALP
jgi:hypothetical protein